MSAIKAKENRTEVALRKALFKIGLRYRKYSAKLPGHPDIVFPREKVAVFVDGDFWHARIMREEGPEFYGRKIRTKNRKYWLDKFQRRIERDDQITKKLTELGWCVLRFWEADIRSDLSAAVSIITYNLRSRRDAVRGT